MTQPMSLTDEKAVVEVIGRGLCIANGYDPDKPDEEVDGPLWLVWADDARAALAALRAAGAEVVFWRPVSEMSEAQDDAEEHYWSDPDGDVTHFAILRGPEVKP